MPQAAQSQFQYIKLPDGSYAKMRADASDATIRASIDRAFPGAFKSPEMPPPPKMGFFGGVRHELLDAGKGIIAPFQPPQTTGEKALGLLGPGALPISRVLKSEAQTRPEAFRQAGQQFHTAGTIKGDPFLKTLEYIRGLTTGATGLLPVPGIAGMSTNLNRVADTHNTPELLGRGLTDAALLALGGKKAESVVDRAREVDPVAPLERTVRSKIAPRLRPVNDHALAEIVRIAREPDILPTVKEFADRTGNPLRDELQVARAAQDAGKEISGYYRENFIDPLSDTDSGFHKIGPDGKPVHLTVQQAYSRLGDINKMLQPAYLKGTVGPEIAGQGLIDLTRERDSINAALYQTLAEHSGLPVEQIQRISQRGASLLELGSQMEKSRDALEQGVAGFDRVGNALPHTPYHPLFQLVVKAVNSLRGGDVAIANRGVRRAVRNFPRGYEPLPEPSQISRYRQMHDRSELARLGSESDMARANRQASAARKPAGLGPTDKDSFLKPEVVSAQKTLTDFVERQKGRQSAANGRAERLANALRQQKLREQERLARAREIQNQARVATDYRGSQ